MAYLMIVLGFVLIIFLISISISKSRWESELDKRKETETKIKLQSFILAAKEIFPSSKIKLLYDRTVVLETHLLNPNGKKIGFIEIAGDRKLKYSTNAPYYLLIVRVGIDDKLFEERENFIMDDSSNQVLETLKEMTNRLFLNDELKRRIIATTY